MSDLIFHYFYDDPEKLQQIVRSLLKPLLLVSIVPNFIIIESVFISYKSHIVTLSETNNTIFAKDLIMTPIRRIILLIAERYRPHL